MRLALLALTIVAPSGAAAGTLTLRDAWMGYAMSDLVEVNQELKRNLASAGAEADPALQGCLLRLLHAEDLSFRGVVDLSTSVNVAAQMQTSQDENAALQGSALEARWLIDDISRAKAEVEKTISRCQKSPDVQTAGKRLIGALDVSADATRVIVEKTQDVRVDMGSHEGDDPQ